MILRSHFFPSPNFSLPVFPGLNPPPGRCPPRIRFGRGSASSSGLSRSVSPRSSRSRNRLEITKSRFPPSRAEPRRILIRKLSRTHPSRLEREPFKLDRQPPPSPPPPPLIGLLDPPGEAGGGPRGKRRETPRDGPDRRIAMMAVPQDFRIGEESGDSREEVSRKCTWRIEKKIK